jgi:hypothetical protein
MFSKPAITILQANGGFAFATSPSCPATRARLLWSAQSDASVLQVKATTAPARDADAFDLNKLCSFATLVVGPERTEHLVLSDGYRRIRIDVSDGSLRAGPVHLRYNLQGFTGIDPQILTLRRLFALYRLGRFARNLHPREPLAPRWLSALRVHDATAAGASQREIAAVIYGQKSAMVGRDNGSDFLRLRVQRLVRIGRRLVSGGYLALLR